MTADSHVKLSGDVTGCDWTRCLLWRSLCVVYFQRQRLKCNRDPLFFSQHATFTAGTRRARSPLSMVEPIAHKFSRSPFVLQGTTRDFYLHDASSTKYPAYGGAYHYTDNVHAFKASELTRYRRSEAQQERRQRELAAVMERDLLSKDQTSESMRTVRSRAQKFRRQVEKAQKSLEANPDCDLTDSLRKILDLNIDNFSRHWHKSYWDRMSHLY
ncbi:hypothetical protein C8J57DRAFT_1471538 [Mycena rebaudengoi]|nr:hypothetical protein C8J57DRAFT_1471538 [Mycena rebaudengoi]